MPTLTYNADDLVLAVTAQNPSTGAQTTRYQYGTTLADSSVARNDLKVAEIYADAVDSLDRVGYAYNRQSQPITKTDQNGNVHDYSYDRLGRLFSDAVTAFGSGVDTTVQRIGVAYEIRGMVSLITSYGSGSAIVNQVTLSYNDFEQLIDDQQDQSASGGPNLTVEYGYWGGSGNTIRRYSTVYPYDIDTGIAGYAYNAGDDSALNRVSSIGWSWWVGAAYTYFGLRSFASTAYHNSTINSTLVGGSSYPGLDQFGRVTDLPWSKSSTGDLAQLQYGYDQASNRTYRQDLKAGSGFDELYSYDGLHRLTIAARGTLQSGDSYITSPKLQQVWGLDATGNWSTFNNFDQTTADNTLSQQRTSNVANEITAIGATVGSAWQTPAYDRNGNMTTIPQPLAPASGYTSVWDAWNRLIYLQSADGLENVESCLYDGLNRRVNRVLYSDGSPTETRYFIYSDRWQVLEEYVSTSLTIPDVQWLWGQRYIDDCVLRSRDFGSEILYSLQDANWNVVALYSTASSAVVERYAYTAYGVVEFLNGSFAPLGGNVSAYEWETLYCGYRYDSRVGFYVVRYRWFNPPIGAWLSVDLITLHDSNLYR